MGERETCAPDPWGALLAHLFEHELAKLLFEAEATMLGKPSAALVLYDHLRSFIALKSAVKNTEPQSGRTSTRPRSSSQYHRPLVHGCPPGPAERRSERRSGQVDPWRA